MKLLAFALMAITLWSAQESTWSERDVARAKTHSPLPPPRPNATNRYADDPRAALLGQRLFFDARLSANGAVSCATCHVPDLGFSDGKSLSTGLARTERNSPSLWNVAQQRWFFWDGRVDSLWAQAVGPLENPSEMGFDRVALTRALASEPQLAREYEALFGKLPSTETWPEHARPSSADDPLGAAWLAMNDEDRRAATRVAANFGKAIEAYERLLVRGDSPFDRFLAGDAAALSIEAQRGWTLFAGRGNCRSCHSGPSFSDGEFHNLGVPPLGGGKPEDSARYAGVERVLADPLNALGEFSDARDGAAALALKTLERAPENFGEYRTPSLRNVALSAPYMHQGQFRTLAEVVRFYSTLEGATQVGHHQEQVLQPLQLSEGEQRDLVAFLESLTGAPPAPALLAPLPDQR